MHPALSVIFFTTFSGTGYGLLFLLGLLPLTGFAQDDIAIGVVSIGAALSFITAGLLSSTLHLHHPERAWRSLSQWRSSWLSREGVAAIATYVPALAFGWLWINGTPNMLVGIAMALCAAITVGTTAMIYASLKPIRQWHNPFVVPLYFGFALMLGALWLAVVFAGFGVSPNTWIVVYFAVAGAVWALKLAYWRQIDRGQSTSSVQTATGLSGKVEILDPPHTEENYLLKEMGYRVARKHAIKLRQYALAFGAIFPVIMAVVAFALAETFQFPILLIAALGATAGTLIERWLFFAEATHTVTLYYGEAA